MRTLSQIEKEICKRILQGNGRNNFLSNIIDNELKRVCIYVDFTKQKSHLIFTVNNIQNITPEEYTDINQRTESITFYILQVVNLIHILEKEGYILLLERGVNSTEPSQYGRCISNLPSIKHDFVDKNIIKLLCEYSNKEIYATAEFERFCQKDFLARDEQRFRKQILFTQIALGITLLAFLFNILTNISKKNDIIKLDKKQFELIIKSLQK